VRDAPSPADRTAAAAPGRAIDALPPPLDPPSARMASAHQPSSFARYRWVLALCVIGAAGVVLVAAFQRSHSLPRASGTTITHTSTPTTTTTPTSTTTPTTTPSLPVAPQPSASAAADALVGAWSTGNRPVALSVATQGAVDTLFAVPYPGGLADSRGCSTGTPTVTCSYGPPGGGDPSDPIYLVTVSVLPNGTWYISGVQIER